jgi:hypothetical protein
MTARGGGPIPTELQNMGPRGVPTYLLKIAERWHRNLLYLAKECNLVGGTRSHSAPAPPEAHA